MRRIVMLVAALAMGCASGFREMHATLPKAESDAFTACQSFVEARTCTTGTDFYREACLADVAKTYTRLPDTSARRAFLVQSGCPEALVSTKL